MAVSAYGERIARVEVEVQALKQSLEEHKLETAKNFFEVRQQFEKQDRKLDDLLALRNKGAGILWLLGGAGFTGVIAVLSQLFGWFK